jgi:diaminohydroxyphosphoribosylaminopyrimidine deaminase / 5-amino-6-(5-phosphoribosylamino)uracil reductase
LIASQFALCTGHIGKRIWGGVGPTRADGGVNEEEAWCWLLSLVRARARPTGQSAIESGTDPAEIVADAGVHHLLDLYLPLCRDCPERFVVGHLGQSLDGRIAIANGASQWVTGPEDVIHNHRMRALFDAVVVGAGTVRHDDPQLTVRAVEGEHPVRVVLDPGRRLRGHFRFFSDKSAPTLLLCDAALVRRGDRQGQAEVVGVPLDERGLGPRAVLDCLAGRGLCRVFVEGGGVTVSRFLADGCLSRLQITVAPVILGSGRLGIVLPEIERVNAALRPQTRRFLLGEDVLFECRFDG